MHAYFLQSMYLIYKMYIMDIRDPRFKNYSGTKLHQKGHVNIGTTQNDLQHMINSKEVHKNNNHIVKVSHG